MLALFMVSLCSVTAWAAEREMPTAPVTTLTSGGKYYLYNVDAVGCFNPYTTFLPDTIRINQVEGTDLWDLYMYSNPSYGYYDYNQMGLYNQQIIVGYGARYTSFVIEPSGNQTYKIQLPKDHSSYNKDFYVGVADDYKLSWQCIENQHTNWLLLPANEDGYRYVGDALGQPAPQEEPARPRQ